MAGREATLADPHPRARAGILDRLATPPGRALTAASAALALVTLWDHSVPGGHGIVFLATLLGWLTLAAFGAVRLAAAVIVRQSRARILSEWRRWSLLPMVAIVTLVLVVAVVPLRARFAVGEADMTTWARAAMTTPPPAARGDVTPIAEPPARLGTFAVARAERFQEGVRFLVSGAGFIDPTGFAYSPDAAPPVIGADRYVHMRGPWYVWIESF